MVYVKYLSILFKISYIVAFVLYISGVFYIYMTYNQFKFGLTKVV